MITPQCRHNSGIMIFTQIFEDEKKSFAESRFPAGIGPHQDHSFFVTEIWPAGKMFFRNH